MINQNKMTAVEQLIDQLTSVGVLEIPQGSNVVTYIIQQAKEMEKEQIKKSFSDGAQWELYGSDLTYEERAKQYYNITFKQK